MRIQTWTRMARNRKGLKQASGGGAFEAPRLIQTKLALSKLVLDAEGDIVWEIVVGEGNRWGSDGPLTS